MIVLLWPSAHVRVSIMSDHCFVFYELFHIPEPFIARADEVIE
jgi:hypothetical protein